MSVVLKYPLIYDREPPENGSIVEIIAPIFAYSSLQFQDGKPTLWLHVEGKSETIPRLRYRFGFYFTGEDIPDGINGAPLPIMGTLQYPCGIVYHVVDVTHREMV